MAISQPIPRSICIAGADGAGKSTQAERLVARLERAGHAVRLCTIWDLMDGATEGAIPFGSKAEIDRFLGALHGDARAMFLHMAMREALDRALDTRGDAVLVVVGYWMKYNATERAYGAQPALLEALGAAFPSLELAIHLDLTPQVALSRKQAISGYESGLKGREGFLAFQQAVAPELARLRAASGMTWHHVDGAQEVDAVEQAIARLVTTWLAAQSTV